MKHPALVRVLAVALAVVSVLTLLSGAVCIRKAAKDNAENTRQYDVLSNKTDNAVLLQKRLEEDRADFDSADFALPDTQTQYDADIFAFRKELAAHTATRAGLVVGRNALGMASSALETGLEQYQQGLDAYEQGAAAFEEGYQQYLAAKQGLEQGWAAYDEAMAQLEANSGELAQKRQQVEILMSAVTASREKIAELKEYIAGLKEQMPVDQAALEEKLKELEALINELAPKLSQYEKDMLVYQAACALYGQAENLIAALVEQGYSEEEVLAKADELCMQGFGMSFQELKLWLDNNKPVLDEENQEIQDRQIQIQLTQEQYEALLKLINENEGLLDSAEEALSKAEERLAEQEAQLQAALDAMDEPYRQLAQMKDQLEAAQKLLDESEPAILEGKAQLDAAREGLELAEKAITEGHSQLDAGWGQMAAKERELADQAEELKAEKTRLEGVYDDIGALELTVEDYESLEGAYSAARAGLLAYEGVAARVNGGGELIASAKAELQEMQDNEEQEYRGRLLMSMLMILCGVFGILSVLIAFEKIKCRGLWLFVLAAVLLSAGSVLCSLLLGRGLLYTAVFVVFFGLILLPLTTTGHKKVKQS